MKHFLKKPFLLFDELFEIVSVDRQTICEERVGETPRRLWNETRMSGDRLKMRLDPGPKAFWLPAQFQMVVKYLAPLVSREIMHVDDDLALSHKGKEPSFRSFRARLYM